LRRWETRRGSRQHARAGILPGAAVAERVRNPRFAREWDQHLDACVIQLETLLVEKATAMLAGGFTANDTRDKWLVGLVQWLLESRQTPTPRTRRAGMRDALPAQTMPKPPDAGRNEMDDSRKVAALIESARVRLAESEAQLARDGLSDEPGADAA